MHRGKHFGSFRNNLSCGLIVAAVPDAMTGRSRALIDWSPIPNPGGTG